MAQEDELILLEADDLAGLAKEIHDSELARRVTAIGTHGGKNFAVLKTPARTPSKKLLILPDPGQPPNGASEICKGSFAIGPAAIKVTVFRLA